MTSICPYIAVRSQDNSGSIVIEYELVSWSYFWVGVGIFLFPIVSRPGLGLKQHPI
jgi:hypothetical protein